MKVGDDADLIILGNKKYVACGYPRSAAAFWTMIFEQRSKLIVKLNQTVANVYWPSMDEKEARFDNLNMTVSLRSEEPVKGSGILTKRVFLVTKGPPGREIALQVVHLDFLAWPDMMIPDATEFASLIFAVKTAEAEVAQNDRKNSLCIGEEDGSPENSELPSLVMTVHCTGGIGRTGTFIAVHATYDVTEPAGGSKDAGPDFIKLRNEMRAQRKKMMIETAQQFAFAQAMYTHLKKGE